MSLAGARPTRKRQLPDRDIAVAGPARFPCGAADRRKAAVGPGFPTMPTDHYPAGSHRAAAACRAAGGWRCGGRTIGSAAVRPLGLAAPLAVGALLPEE